MVSVNRNIVEYNKYFLVITVVVVFVSYCYSYCDFRWNILESLLVCSSSSSSILCTSIFRTFTRTQSVTGPGLYMRRFIVSKRD